MANKHLLADGLFADVMSKLASPAINVLKATIGHYLHTFLSDADVDRARRLVERSTVKRDLDNHLLALQLVETWRIANKNALTDQATALRIRSYEKARQALQTDLDSESKWYEDNIKSLKYMGATTVYQTLVDTKIALKRDADNDAQLLLQSKLNHLAAKFGAENVKLFKLPPARVPQPLAGDVEPSPIPEPSFDERSSNNTRRTDSYAGGMVGKQQAGQSQPYGQQAKYGQQTTAQGNSASNSTTGRVQFLAGAGKGQSSW
jgi:hypothetical protein